MASLARWVMRTRVLVTFWRKLMRGFKLRRDDDEGSFGELLRSSSWSDLFLANLQLSKLITWSGKFNVICRAASDSRQGDLPRELRECCLSHSVHTADIDRKGAQPQINSQLWERKKKNQERKGKETRC
ncbi:hypothetical protein VTO42DRAFT_3534 [Malbranchea cinnamomea]